MICTTPPRMLSPVHDVCMYPGPAMLRARGTRRNVNDHRTKVPASLPHYTTACLKEERGRSNGSSSHFQGRYRLKRSGAARDPTFRAIRSPFEVFDSGTCHEVSGVSGPQVADLSLADALRAPEALLAAGAVPGAVRLRRS